MKRRKIIVTIYSLLLTIFSIIGNSFIRTNSLDFIKNHILLNILIFSIVFCALYFLIKYIFIKLDKFNYNHQTKSNRIYKYFDKHPFIFSLIVILVCWLPYIISFYPAILSPDPSHQIMQFFNIDNKYSTYSILLDENVIITNHHPVIHTLLLGGSLKLGRSLVNDNFGLFIYSLIQIGIMSSVFAYTISFLKKLKVRSSYLMVMLGIYALVPAFPLYAMSCVKDGIYTSFIILYIISLFKIIKYDKSDIKAMTYNFVLMILVILFRNNGFYIIVLSLPLVLFIKSRNRKKYLLLTLLVIGFNFSYNKIILPAFKITPTSIREALSIPFQQTARYVKEYDKEITEEDKKIIDKILTYDTIKKRYDAEKSDPIKNEYNKYATNEDLKNYFKVWFNGFFKHPMTYVEATLNNTYGYYYPFKTNWYVYYKYDTRIVEKGFDYHYNELKGLRSGLSSLAVSFPYIPIIGLITNIGFNTWILLGMILYLTYKKMYKYIIYLMPSFVSLLVCLASPVNAYFRYAMPIVFAMPLLIGLLFTKKEGVRNER